ncbi:MAG: RND-type efflux system membrane fusion component [Bacteroidetes bacterium HLUCCA01]|nr:MAG: RND-type efflux system membrane fusion component [Bacteroidetes bacterium HLUCCA01]
MLSPYNIFYSFKKFTGFYLVTFALAACGSPEPSNTTTPPPTHTSPQETIFVQTQPVSIQDTSIPVQVIGQVSSATSFNLSFRTGGFIDEILVDEGDRVSEGQRLAKLNQRETEALLLRAEAMFAQSMREMNRIQNLYNDSAATQQQLDNQQTVVDVSRAELELARFNAEKSEIIAPQDGIILRKMTEINEQVRQGDAVFTMGTRGNEATVVLAGVSDRHIYRLKTGDTALFSSSAYPNKQFEGKVTRIPSQANNRTGVFDIEITLNGSAHELKNGFILRGSILPQTTEPLIAIPIAALVEADGNAVWMYTPDASGQSANRIRVQPVHIANEHFYVRSEDLNGITRIITRGSAYVRPGSAINISEETVR